MEFQEIKSLMIENDKSAEIIAQFYNDEITGLQLMQQIIVNSPLMVANYRCSYLEFLNQLNFDKKFSKSGALPYRSSGGFFHAFFDNEFYQEYENLNENEITQLDAIISKSVNKSLALINK
tara:strand:+ start:255 stop:617 length:363 start_codon:yes stop_codon:yes gene_type:complete